MEESFSVYQFLINDDQDRITDHVSMMKAVEKFQIYTTNYASKIGITKRVIITDAGDRTVMEWKFGEGLTFPPEAVEKWNERIYHIKKGEK